MSTDGHHNSQFVQLFSRLFRIDKTYQLNVISSNQSMSMEWNTHTQSQSQGVEIVSAFTDSIENLSNKRTRDDEASIVDEASILNYRKKTSFMQNESDSMLLLHHIRSHIVQVCLRNIVHH